MGCGNATHTILNYAIIRWAMQNLWISFGQPGGDYLCTQVVAYMWQQEMKICNGTIYWRLI
jgi:hypothetical protein